MSELRAATGAAHTALDAKLRLFDGSVTRTRYEAFLRGSLYALGPLEPALAVWSTHAICKSGLIRADLAALGRSLPGSARVPGDTPRIDNEAQAFGARYVVEGSALGGVVLGRVFQKTLELSADALHYLGVPAAEVRQRWRTFVDELELWGKNATLEERREACDTARAVFDLYQRAFESAGAFSPQP